MNLSPDELSRYQRHLSLPGFGLAAQQRLKGGRVLVIGAGGLGCPALLYLAAAGVGRITIVDDDRVEPSNLQRQVLFTTADAGQPKAGVAASRLRANNPHVEIQPLVARFNRANAAALVADCDVVLDGSDNFATRYLVNDACVLGDRPFVYGAIQAFEGQVSVFNWKGGPTYRCLFPEPPPAGTVPNCAEAGVLGVLPGMIGTLQACETLKLLTGIGEPLSGRLLLWNALTMQSRLVGLKPDPRSRQIHSLPDDPGETCRASVLQTPNEETDIQVLRAALKKGTRLQLIDVREGWERRQGAIEPSTHLPLGSLATGEADPEIMALDPRLPTVIYCAVGVRSLHGARILRERYGFRDVVSLRGGLAAWSQGSL